MVSKNKRQGRKRQTRLAFTPIPSSSPQAAKDESQIQGRTASVKVDSSPIPIKKGKTKGEDLGSSSTKPSADLTDTSANALATPMRSSQFGFLGRRSSRQMGFGNEAYLDDSDSDDDQHQAAIIPSLGPFEGEIYPMALESSDDNEELDHISSSQPRKRRGQPAVISSHDKSDSSRSQPKKKLKNEKKNKNKKGKGRQPRKNSPKGKTTSRSRTRVQPVSALLISELDESNYEVVPPSKRRRSSRLQTQPEAIVVNGEDDDIGSPSKRRRIIRHPQSQSLLGSSHSSSDEDMPISSATRRIRRRIRPKIPEPLTESDSSDSLEVVSGRNLKPRAQLSSPLNSKRRQEVEDLKEDLLDLQDSDSGIDTTSRSRRDQKEKRKAQLELLRKRRAGQKVEIPALHLGECSDHDGIPDHSDHTGETDDTNLQSDAAEAVGDRELLPDGEEQEDDDFIVDDEEDHLGVPTELPFEFSLQSRKKTEEYFKDVVEWMVQNKLNPAFARDDQVYRLAFNKVDDVARGFAGSKFSSSAWKADFIKALKARPDMIIRDTDQAEKFDQHCQACGRKGHPAGLAINFRGKAYHRDSLEEVTDDEDEDDDEIAEDRQSYDSEGNALPPENQEFLVGRHCKANAEMTHTLTHWKHHLNSWVLDWLDGEGHLTADKTMEREGWNRKKRFRYANEVVDTMERTRQMKDLWRDFKLQIEAAREAKVRNIEFAAIE
ncbi:MAG: hypothetical protein M1834_005449 [Cirrosporium novae-zelandiae]|nr:MAG: hypothetical protein M1834_005449 [Cirrosporium novae-zelandiae]